MPELTGPQLIDDLISNPQLALDRVLDRDPHALPHSDDELRALVIDLRNERAQIELKQEKAKDKKAGITDDNNPSD